MTRAFKLAFEQLGDKSFRRVIWIGIIGSAIIFALLWAVVGYLLFNTSLFALDGWLSFLNDWLEGITDALGTALVVFLSWLLFPSVVTLIVSFYLEATAQAVEDKHYSHLPETRGQPLSEVLLVTIKFSLLAIFLNILALPIYAILFFIGPFNLFGPERGAVPQKRVSGTALSCRGCHCVYDDDSDFEPVGLRHRDRGDGASGSRVAHPA